MLTEHDFFELSEKLAGHGAGRVVINSLISDGLKEMQKEGKEVIELPIRAIKAILDINRHLEMKVMVYEQLLKDKGGYTDLELEKACLRVRANGLDFIESLDLGRRW